MKGVNSVPIKVNTATDLKGSQTRSESHCRLKIKRKKKKKKGKENRRTETVF